MILKYIEVYRGIVYEIETDPSLTYDQACEWVIEARKHAHAAIDEGFKQCPPLLLT